MTRKVIVTPLFVRHLKNFLDEYAELGAIRFVERLQGSYRAMVEKMVRLAWQLYYSDGRWNQSDSALIPLLDGMVALDDSPLPSSTAVITRLSRQHPDLRKDAELQKKVDAHLQEVRRYLGDSMFWYAGYVALLEAQ